MINENHCQKKKKARFNLEFREILVIPFFSRAVLLGPLEGWTGECSVLYENASSKLTYGPK